MRHVDLFGSGFAHRRTSLRMVGFSCFFLLLPCPVSAADDGIVDEDETAFPATGSSAGRGIEAQVSVFLDAENCGWLRRASMKGAEPIL